MTRYTASTITGAGSSTLPVMSLYAGTTVRPHIREIHIFNTTATAVSLKIARLSTTGTQGTALTEMALVPEDRAAIATAFATHSGAPTITAGDLWRGVLGAAIGAGVILTFPEEGLVIDKVANAGVGIVPTGTGQILECTIMWDEG